MSTNVNVHPQMQQYRILPHPPASPRSMGMTSSNSSPLPPRLHSARPGVRPQAMPVGMGSHSAPSSRLARAAASDGTPPTIRKTTGTSSKPGSKLASGSPSRALPKRPITVMTTSPTVWLDSKPLEPRRPHTSDTYSYQSRKQHSQGSSQLSALSLSKLDVSAFNEGAEISSVCFTCENLNNHTSRFHCDDTEVILRRGNSLNMTINTTFPILYNCLITLTFIPAFRPQDRFAYFKTEKNVKTTKKRVSLGIPIPPNFPVGKYHTHVAMTKRNGKDIITHFHHKAIVVLFNPWNPLDEVYLEEECQRETYLLDDVGTIWRGVESCKVPLEWEYGQYEEHCLDVALYLLRELNSEECKSVVSVCRELMAQLNSCDHEGVLLESPGGRGVGSHVGGMHPSRWTGSTAILGKYYHSRNIVRYGQCWVFAGVGTTLLRALGIPSRPVTCYNAAHTCRKLGQVERFFVPTGNMLTSLNKDQLWIYHVWIEAYMRRDDLPGGYSGWQALDPTSHGRQGGRFRVGPASVQAIKERLSGKKWPYNGEHVRCEVDADVRYLRSLSQNSYSSNCSNTKVTHLARVNRNEVGTSIVTQSPMSMDTKPLDITACYKTIKTSTQSVVDVDRFFPSPSQDCIFDVWHNKGAKLGEEVELSVGVTNKGAMLRTIDGRVVGYSILYTGEPLCSFMSADFSGVVSPGQNASVLVSVAAKRYLRYIQEQCLLQFFVVVKARENKQLFLNVYNIQLQVPELQISCASTVCLGGLLRVKISFTNTLVNSLSRLLFLLQAQSLCPKRELSYKKLLFPRESASVECTLYPSEIGQFTLLATLCCDQLTDIRGHRKVMVHP